MTMTMKWKRDLKALEYHPFPTSYPLSMRLTLDSVETKIENLDRLETTMKNRRSSNE